MPHVTVPAPRRHLRARSVVSLFRAPPAPPAPIVSRSNPLMAVSTQVIVGFLAPLSVMQIGHWLLSWPRVAVRVGGQG